jgi:hypothetical protein
MALPPQANNPFKLNSMPPQNNSNTNGGGMEVEPSGNAPSTNSGNPFAFKANPFVTN